MMKRLCILLLILSNGCLPVSAQKAHAPQQHKKVAAHKKAQTKKAARDSLTTVVPVMPDTLKKVVSAVPSPDTTAKKDTTLVQKVADVVHDSVKAELKAPIVQVPVTLKSLIIPGILFGYGAVTLNNGSLRVINEEAREFFWDGKTHTGVYIEDYLLLVPAATVYTLNIAGIKGQNNLVDRSIIYGMSNAIANGLGFGLKYLGIEERPDGSDHYSFPSGHTAEAFVSAEFLHQEYKGRVHWSVIAAGYAVGVGTAYLRMYHNKHWLSDVVAGAGVGIASTRFSYYLYPIIKHALFGSRKIKGSTMILPTYRTGGGFGLAFARSF